MQKNAQNIGAKKYVQKHWRLVKTWCMVKTRRMLKTWRLVKSTDAENLAHGKNSVDAKNLAHPNIRCLQKCWRTGKISIHRNVGQQKN